jgi:hypothetical protein
MVGGTGIEPVTHEIHPADRALAGQISAGDAPESLNFS